jgi:hypothetical protein
MSDLRDINTVDHGIWSLAWADVAGAQSVLALLDEGPNFNKYTDVNAAFIHPVRCVGINSPPHDGCERVGRELLPCLEDEVSDPLVEHGKEPGSLGKVGAAMLAQSFDLCLEVELDVDTRWADLPAELPEQLKAALVARL